MCDVSAEVMVKVHVVDLKSESIASPISVRAYLNQTITEFKQLIAQVGGAAQSCPSEVTASSLNLCLWVCVSPPPGHRLIC